MVPGQGHAGVGVANQGHILWAALGHQLTAVGSRFGAQINEPIRCRNEIEVVFDDEQGVTCLDQGTQGPD